MEKITAALKKKRKTDFSKKFLKKTTKIAALTDHLTPQQRESKRSDKKSLIDYLWIQSKYRGNLNKRESLQSWKLKMWGNLLNQWKIAFFNAIKSKETSTIYKYFIGINEIFVPKKFKEKITPQDAKEQKIKRN